MCCWVPIIHIGLENRSDPRAIFPLLFYSAYLFKIHLGNSTGKFGYFSSSKSPRSCSLCETNKHTVTYFQHHPQSNNLRPKPSPRPDLQLMAEVGFVQHPAACARTRRWPTNQRAYLGPGAVFANTQPSLVPDNR